MDLDDNYRVGSLDTGLRILEIMLDRDVASVTGISQELGVARSTAHRALRTLEGRGFVALSSSGRGYVAGPRLVEVGSPRSLDPVSRIANREILARVREETGEAVHTSLLLGAQALVVDGRRSAHKIDIGLRMGMVAPAHSLAAGKLLLSSLSDDQVRALFPQDVLVRTGPRTLATSTALVNELHQIRRDGYAVAIQESERGVSSVAILLSGGSWRDRMSIAVSMPFERGTWEDLMRHLDTLQRLVAEEQARHIETDRVAAEDERLLVVRR